MKCRELFAIERPDESRPCEAHCPGDDDCNYISRKADYCHCVDGAEDPRYHNCEACWDQEVTNQEKLEEVLANHESSEKTWAERIDENLAKANGTTVVNLPYIKDSGERREFETGAVRDIQEGKGRCDLMPLDVVGKWLNSDILTAIQDFKTTGDIDFLYGVLTYFVVETSWDDQSMILQTAKHFEAGAVKYGENNWQKGIPVHCYIDSAVRHYLKFLRGDDDEPHDRAFVWNIMCCIWTCIHKPELNDFCEVKVDE